MMHVAMQQAPELWVLCSALLRGCWGHRYVQVGVSSQAIGPLSPSLSSALEVDPGRCSPYRSPLLICIH